MPLHSKIFVVPCTLDDNIAITHGVRLLRSAKQEVCMGLLCAVHTRRTICVSSDKAAKRNNAAWDNTAVNGHQKRITVVTMALLKRCLFQRNTTYNNVNFLSQLLPLK